MEYGSVSTALKRATRNVMSPGVTLSAVVGIPCISAAVFAQPWIAIWLLIVMTIVCLGTFGIFALHSIKNPNLLRSEDYHLKRDAIEVYGSSSYHGDEVVRIINAEPSSKNTKLLEAPEND